MIVVRRKCFSVVPSERNVWTGTWKGADGKQHRLGNGVQSALGLYGPKTEEQVKVNGRWMTVSEAERLQRRIDNYNPEETVGERYEKDKWVSPWEKEQENRDAAKKEDEAIVNARRTTITDEGFKPDVPTVIAPGKEDEWLEDNKEDNIKPSFSGKHAAIAAGATAAVGAAGYAAYKAWKKKQAKKKESSKQAEDKFKK